MRALVTGSNGFVGRHLLPELKAAGYHILGVDPTYPPYVSPKHHPGEEIENCTFEELLESPEIPVSFGERFDVVVHLAAHIPDVHERTRLHGWTPYQDLALDAAMFRYIEANPPRKVFVYMSSCAVDAADSDPYAFTKVVGERICRSLHAGRIPVVILRPFSGYGADQADSYPFPAILKRALRRENPLTVWGSGGQIRDFIHIDDLVRGIVHGIEYFPRGEPVELGTGIPNSFLTLAGMMAQAVGYTPKIHGDREKEESSLFRLMRSQIASRCGWRARICLEDGIQRAIGELTDEKGTNEATP